MNNDLLRRAHKLARDPAYLAWKLSTQYRRKAGLLIRTLLPRKRPKRLACMIHVGRSGSTVLADLLDQHSAILWDGEIYREQLETLRGPETVMAYLDRRTRLAARNEVYGFEVKPYHLELMSVSLKAFIAALPENTAIIVLERRNYLRKIVSSLIAKQSSVWHRPNSGTTDGRPQIHIRPEFAMDGRRDSIDGLLAYYDAQFRELRALVGDALWLTYEDHLLPSPTAACSMIIERLGLDAYTPTVRYGRTNPEPLEQLVANFPELQQSLGRSPFAWMLES